jgi:hypothetical protein
MNASSAGAYLLYGEGEAGAPPVLRLTQGEQVQASFTFSLAANMAPEPGTVEGPLQLMVETPPPGGWMIEFAMGASNMRAVILVTAETMG